MATKDKSFAQYYSEALAKNKKGTTVAPKASKPLDFSGANISGSQGAAPDPITWALDILSRPLHSVLNTANAGLDIIDKKNVTKSAAKLKKGDISGVLGDIGNVVGAPARGLLSTDKKDKPYTGNLIEKLADTEGSYNPDYENTTDNVNPVFKGVAGFIGDVGLDPLTYVPGAAIATVGRGIKKGVDVARGSEAVAKSAAKKAEKVAAKEAATEGAIKTLDEGGEVATKEEADLLLRQDDLANAPVKAPEEVPPVTVVDEVPPIQVPVVEKVVEELKGVNPSVAKVILKPSEELAASPKLPLAKTFLNDLNKIPDAGKPQDYDTFVENFITKAPKEATFPNPLYGLNPTAPARLPVSRLNTKAARKEGGILSSIKVQNYLKTAHGKYVTKFNETAAKSRAKTAPAGVANPKEVFRTIVENAAAKERAEQALGSVLVNRLKRSSAANFNRIIKEIEDTLERSDVLDAVVKFDKKQSTFNSLMKHFGITPAKTNVAIMSATSHVQEAIDAGTKAGKISAVEPVIPSEVVRDALEGATRRERLEQMNESVKRIMSWLPTVIKDEFFNPAYKYRTRGGIARTHPQWGEGMGINDKIFNQYTQWNILKALQTKHLAALKAEKIGGPARALELEKRTLEDLKLVEDMFEREGFQFYVGTSKADAFPMKLSQLYEIIADSGAKEGGRLSALRKYLFNYSTMVPNTNLSDAAVLARLARPYDEIRAALANKTRSYVPKSWYNKNGTIAKAHQAEMEMPNRLVDGEDFAPGVRVYGFTPASKTEEGLAKQLKTMKGKNTDRVRYIPKYETVGGKKTLVGWSHQYSSEALLDELTQMLVDSGTFLRNVSAQNARALEIKIGTESKEMTAEALAHLDELYQDPTKIAESLHATALINEHIEALARNAGATVDAKRAAVNAVNRGLDQDVKATAETLTKAGEAAQKAGTPNATAGKTPKKAVQDVVDATKPILQAGADDAMDATDEGIENFLKIAPEKLLTAEERAIQAQAIVRHGDPTLALSDSVYPVTTNLIERIMEPLGKLFVNDYGMKTVKVFYNQFARASAMRREKFLQQLRQLQKAHAGNVGTTDVPILTKAFRDTQAGARSADPKIAAAQKDLEELFSKLWDTHANPNSIIGNPFFGSSISIEALNRTFKEVGLVNSHGELIQIEIDVAIAAHKASGRSLLTEAMSQWRGWDLADPLDAINRMYSAAEKIATDAATVQSFTRYISKAGLVSKVPKEGFARIVKGDKESRFYDMLDKDLYFDKNIINELGILDRVAQMSATPTGPLGTFITKVFAPMQQAWKRAITIYRPGHHPRNMVGDESMTLTMEGMKYSYRSHVDAFKIMSIFGKYDSFDANRALEALGSHTIPGKADVISTGKYGDISFDEAAEAMFQKGTVNSYHIIEDLTGSADPNKFEQFIKTISLGGGKIERFAGGVAEAREHYVRIQHFLQVVHKAQKSGVDDYGKVIKDREDLFLYAAKRVQKGHPDASTLTNFERTYMRHIFPFYTWLRGALPTVVETTLMHPGRALVIPKASYNIAVAAGIDPYSMSDPFPTDQMFPSFLTEQVLGPQMQLESGEYINVNPGFAGVDIANMLAPNPVRGVAGFVSPFIRTPAEIMSGGSWGTGAKIRDNSDYIDASIPGINYVANVSGFSPTGSVTSLLQGKGLDEQAQVAAGNKGPLDQQLSLLNYFTGLSVNNQSRENYQNFAEIEKRNREGDQRSGY